MSLYHGNSQWVEPSTDTVVIWSTTYYPGGAQMGSTTDRFFSAPVGSVGQGFTRSVDMTLTNIKESGRVPHGGMNVTSVRTEFIPGTADDPVRALVEGWRGEDPTESWHRKLVERSRMCVLMWDYIQTRTEMGVPSMADGPIDSPEDGPKRIGWLRPLVFEFDYREHPVHLPDNCNFGVLLSWSSATPPSPDFYVRIQLKGHRPR